MEISQLFWRLPCLLSEFNVILTSSLKFALLPEFWVFLFYFLLSLIFRHFLPFTDRGKKRKKQKKIICQKYNIYCCLCCHFYETAGERHNPFAMHVIVHSETWCVWSFLISPNLNGELISEIAWNNLKILF